MSRDPDRKPVLALPDAAVESGTSDARRRWRASRVAVAAHHWSCWVASQHWAPVSSLFGAIAEDVQEQEANALDADRDHVPARPGEPGPRSAHEWADRDGLHARRHRAVRRGGPAPALAAPWPRGRCSSVVAIGGSVVLDELLKLVFHRPRPQLAWAQVQPEYSFPSGHSMNSLVFYLAFAIIVGRLWSRRGGHPRRHPGDRAGRAHRDQSDLPRLSLPHGCRRRPARRTRMAAARVLGVRHGRPASDTATAGCTPA